MSDQVFFAHANGFPTASYCKLLAALEPKYQLHFIAQHGHDPRFPVGNNWQSLVDELIFHVKAVGAPVWGVGHSLGGALHYQAAARHPELYRGLIMLDSPVLSTAERWVVKLAKQCGFIDHLTPARRTAGRRERFENRLQARDYFAGKHLFSRFDPDCLDDYVEHALVPDADGIRLGFDPALEMRIYRSVPDNHTVKPKHQKLPLVLLRGRSSRVVYPFHARQVKRMPFGEFVEVPGGHMFPLEQPQATAQLIDKTLQRWISERV